MTRTRRTAVLMLLLSAASSVALGWTHAAHAQQADQPEADQASAGSGIEEITVTARRRDEKLQSVPIAVATVSATAISERSIEDFNDLQFAVPSLSVVSGNSRYSQNYTSLRGLGASSVVTYFAEVPGNGIAVNGGNSLGLGQTYDLQNIQVLAGPQGTLFGRSAVGGAILFEPNRPTDHFEGYVQVGLGDYNLRELEVVANIPIIDDKLMVRFAGQREGRDGFTTDVGPVNYGKTYDNRDYWSERLGITFRPTDNIENYTLFTSFYNDDHGTGYRVLIINPNGISEFGGLPLSALFKNVYSLFAVESALPPHETENSANFEIDKAQDYGVTDILRWDISDDLTLRNIASSSVTKNLQSYDIDGSLINFSQNLGAPYRTEPWDTDQGNDTEELQLQGKSFDEKMTWVIGGFLSFSHPVGNPESGNEGPFIPGAPISASTISESFSRISSREQAIYAQDTFDLGGILPALDGLSLTTGYRYTWDYTSTSAKSFGTFGGCTSGYTLPGCSAPTAENYTHKPTWTLGLDYKIDPDTLAYVRSGRGFLGGSTTNSNPPGYQIVLPESYTDVEVGVKSDWDVFGVKGRLNVDGYLGWAEDIQQTVGLYIPGRGVVAGVINAASADLKGVELQYTVIPTTGLELSGYYDWEQAQYTKFVNPAVGDQTGLPYRFYPRHKLGINIRYQLPLDPALGEISVVGDAAFQTRQYIAPDAEPDGYIAGYGLANFNVEWTNIYHQPVDLNFFITNATDTVYRLANQSAYYQIGYVGTFYGEPRMWGFRLKYRFDDRSAAETASAAVYVPPPAQPVAPAVAHSYMVFFDFNKSDLTPQAASIVDTAAKNAAATKVTQLTVTGHTDTVGSDAYNLRLSRRRAESVASELERQGIPSSEIELVAKGKHDLLVPTGDGVREPQNRRVQIVYAGA